MRDRARIMAAGAACLLAELTVLRYVPGQVRVLGYFTNLVLLAAFLGLGVGMLSLERWPAARSIAFFAPVALLALVGLTEGARHLRVTASQGEFLFLEYQRGAAKVPLYPFLATSYVLVAICFAPLGRWVGSTLSGDRPLARYAWNIVGSLVGIAAFVALAASGAPPWVWMASAGVLSLGALREAPLAFRFTGVAAVVLAAWLCRTGARDALWSPYQKISVASARVHPALGVVQEWTLPRLTAAARADLVELPTSQGFTVRVNDDSYQTPIDLRAEAVAGSPGLAALKAQYELPYDGRAPGDVLILGAGTGNDVAAALRSGARHVDAVEIDPEILRLGARHPERPYEDPRVDAHLADARSFLARSDRRFDTIVYGLLDSHVLLGNVSNVRLDSYVFTAESFAAARAHLEPGGVLVLSHAVGLPWFVERMRATLTAAFGRPPDLVSERARNPVGFVYAAGESVPAGSPVDPDTDILEDDWPFVYLRARAIPTEYLVAMTLMAAASLAMIRGVAGSGRGDGRALHFAALGAGFLLLETRGLSVLALVLGSTWEVTSAVFAGVLVMALASTGIAARMRADGARLGSSHVGLVYGLLLATLVVELMVTTGQLSALPLGVRATVGALLVALPLLAGGTVFSTSLAQTDRADRALAANLIGAMGGGLLEYLAMVVGFRALVLIAAAIYGLAFLSRPAQRERPLPAAS